MVYYTNPFKILLKDRPGLFVDQTLNALYTTTAGKTTAKY